MSGSHILIHSPTRVKLQLTHLIQGRQSMVWRIFECSTLFGWWWWAESLFYYLVWVQQQCKTDMFMLFLLPQIVSDLDFWIYFRFPQIFHNFQSSQLTTSLSVSQRFWGLKNHCRGFYCRLMLQCRTEWLLHCKELGGSAETVNIEISGGTVLQW